jgi:hypothetical protein
MLAVPILATVCVLGDAVAWFARSGKSQVQPPVSTVVGTPVERRPRRS